MELIKNQIIYIIRPYLYHVYLEVWNAEKNYREFQRRMKRIAAIDGEKITVELAKILATNKISMEFLDKLLNTQISGAANSLCGGGIKNVNFNSNSFLKACFLEVSRKVYIKPWTFEDSMGYKVEEFLAECVSSVLQNAIPFEQVFEIMEREEEEKETEKDEQTDEQTEEDAGSPEEDTGETGDAEKETKDGSDEQAEKEAEKDPLSSDEKNEQNEFSGFIDNKDDDKDDIFVIKN